MSSTESLGVSPEDATELRRIAHAVVVPVVERNFGDDTDAEFNDQTIIATPDKAKLLPGETAVEAHLRLQKLTLGEV